MIHGEEDLLIPIEWSQKTRDLLLLKNYDVNWFKYKGVKHELSFSILDYIVKYVIDIL
jgi:predicted esterase